MWEFDIAFVSKMRNVLALWAFVFASVKAEIRCYCNQPSCVSTGYMCKSASGVCFTELFSYSTDLSKSRHGCAELLSAAKRAQCRPPKSEISSLPAVLCCQEDMCNYMNTLDINIQVHTNHSLAAGQHDFTKERHAYEAALQQDIWFKAAVIAVPIAGGFILILLILLATRMLRQDSKRQRQLLELRHQSRLSYGKPPLLLPCATSHVNCGFCATEAKPPCRNWYEDAMAERRYVYDKGADCRGLLSWPHLHKSATRV